MFFVFEGEFWLIKLKYNSVVFLFVYPFVTGPADLHRAEVLGKSDGEGLGRNLIRDKLRSAEEVEQGIAEEERREGADLAVVIRWGTGELTAHNLGCVELKPTDDEGIEAFNAEITAVFFQNFICLFAELIVALAVFELDDEA